jgi:hypothetical protein
LYNTGYVQGDGEFPSTKQTKKRKKKMKKLMTLACCAMLALAGFAGGASATPCCGFTGESSCQIWFKGSANGKISTGVANQSYKTVKALQVKSVQLVIADDGSNVVAQVVLSGKKKGVENFTKTLDCTELKWNVFGKNINSTKKEVSLESEIFFQAEDDYGTTQVSGVLFGTVKAKKTGSGCSPCGETITAKYTPGTFKGKYVGFAPATGCACAAEGTAALGEGTCSDTSCLTFVEQTDDKQEYFCGDVTLKFDSKNSGYKAR